MVAVNKSFPTANLLSSEISRREIRREMVGLVEWLGAEATGPAKTFFLQE
jgi:hypothetical protein